MNFPVSDKLTWVEIGYVGDGDGCCIRETIGDGTGRQIPLCIAMALERYGEPVQTLAEALGDVEKNEFEEVGLWRLVFNEKCAQRILEASKLLLDAADSLCRTIKEAREENRSAARKPGQEPSDAK